jgi:surface polysaccharide O-acyltransferase-like enzyme
VPGLGGRLRAATPATIDATRRRFELDLMRAAVVVGVVFFHAASIFDVGDFYVKHRPPSAAVTVVLAFVKLWGMPLLFVVAGLGAWYSLRTRTAAGFLRERCARLLVPLVVGTVLLVPPQVYLSLRAYGGDPGPYWQFLGGFFQVRLSPRVPVILTGADPTRPFELGHLWFLYLLLVYSLVLPPVLRFLDGEVGRRLLERAVALCQRPWGLVALALPAATVEAALGTWDAAGWNHLAYLPFLLFGFLLAAEPQLGRSVRQRLVPLFTVGLAILPALYGIAHFDLGGAASHLGYDYGPWSVIWRVLKAACGWAWTLAIFGLATALVRAMAVRRAAPTATAVAGRAPGPASRVARYANEAVLPFYVLHQTAVVAIGFYVVQSRLAALAQYLLISFASVAATLLVYDLGVRRLALTRLLFGMRPRD